MDSSIVGHWTSFEMVRCADLVDILNTNNSLLGQVYLEYLRLLCLSPDI